jgi:sec-independent protein translocase protein TatB
MDIFGIGPAELFFVILIAIIILGPKDMQKAGRTIGRFLNQLVRSDSWKVFQKTSTEIRNLPRNLMREANLEEANKEIAEAESELQRTLDPRRLDPLSQPLESASPYAHPSHEPESTPPAEPPTVEPTEDHTDKNG